MANIMPPPPPGPQRRAAFGSVSKSTIFPLLGDRSGLVAKSHFIPISATAFTGIALIFANQVHFIQAFKFAELNNALQDCWILGVYVTFMVNYFIYMLCGRDKPWWLQAATFAVMAVLMAGPLLQLTQLYEGMVASAAGPITNAFVGPGLAEEVVKALPVFVLAIVAVRWNDPLTQRIGVTEPLDGILIGVASAAAFALVETLVLYVPGEMAKVVASGVHAVTNYNAQHDVKLPPEIGFDLGIANAQFAGIMMFLRRALPEIAGHIAYSGIFGYFIGLAVLKRSRAPQILLVGLLSAAALHGAWDAMLSSASTLGAPTVVLMMVLIPALSYAFLGSCILKARKISPTRAQNFASTDLDSLLKMQSQPQGQLQPQGQQHKLQAPQQPRVVQAVQTPAAVKLVMQIGPVSLKLKPGLAIEPMDLGSAGAGRGKNPIAEVAAHPKDGNVITLRNLSDRTYRVTLTSGKIVDLPQAKSVQLAPGLVVDFGGIKGSVNTERA